MSDNNRIRMNKFEKFDLKSRQIRKKFRKKKCENKFYKYLKPSDNPSYFVQKNVPVPVNDSNMC